MSAFHSHFGGRPLMTAMFDKLLKFLCAQPDVHFPGHNAIAQWVLERGDRRAELRQPFLRLGRMDGGADQPQT